jgi:hypothetical protein
MPFDELGREGESGSWKIFYLRHDRGFYITIILLCPSESHFKESNTFSRCCVESCNSETSLASISPIISSS